MRSRLLVFFATAALLGGFGLPIQAAEPPALLITKAGFFYIVTDDAGVPVLVKVTKVISIGDTGGIPVPPDTPDVPPQPPAVTVQVQAWAAEVNHPVGAQALGLVYSTVADSLRDGKIDPADSFPAVKKATEQVLPLAGGAERWAGFRAKLGDLITLKLQKGELQHAKDYERFLREVAAGLNSSAAEAPALDPAVIQKIIQLILLILNIFAGGGNDSPI
jgi:hypothetical protein